MTTKVRYAECFCGPKADLGSTPLGALPAEAHGYDGPNGCLKFLQAVAPEGQHCDAFHL